MAEHFGYTEEYVLSHNPAWLKRKYTEVLRERYAQHRLRVIETYKGMTMTLDSAFNKGKNMEKLLPGLYEEDAAEYGDDAREDNNSAYNNTIWWDKEPGA